MWFCYEKHLGRWCPVLYHMFSPGKMSGLGQDVERSPVIKLKHEAQRHMSLADLAHVHPAPKEENDEVTN